MNIQEHANQFTLFPDKFEENLNNFRGEHPSRKAFNQLVQSIYHTNRAFRDNLKLLTLTPGILDPRITPELLNAQIEKSEKVLQKLFLMDTLSRSENGRATNGTRPKDAFTFAEHNRIAYPDDEKDHIHYLGGYDTNPILYDGNRTYFNVKELKQNISILKAKDTSRPLYLKFALGVGSSENRDGDHMIGVDARIDENDIVTVFVFDSNCPYGLTKNNDHKQADNFLKKVFHNAPNDESNLGLYLQHPIRGNKVKLQYGDGRCGFWTNWFLANSQKKTFDELGNLQPHSDDLDPKLTHKDRLRKFSDGLESSIYSKLNARYQKLKLPQRQTTQASGNAGPSSSQPRVPARPAPSTAPQQQVPARPAPSTAPQQQVPARQAPSTAPQQQVPARPAPSTAPQQQVPAKAPSTAPQQQVPAKAPSTAPQQQVPARPAPSTAPQQQVPARPAPSTAPQQQVPARPAPSTAPQQQVPARQAPSTAPQQQVPARPAPSTAPQQQVPAKAPSTAPQQQVPAKAPSTAPQQQVPARPAPSTAPQQQVPARQAPSTAPQQQVPARPAAHTAVPSQVPARPAAHTAVPSQVPARPAAPQPGVVTRPLSPPVQTNGSSASPNVSTYSSLNTRLTAASHSTSPQSSQAPSTASSSSSASSQNHSADNRSLRVLIWDQGKYYPAIFFENGQVFRGNVCSPKITDRDFDRLFKITPTFVEMTTHYKTQLNNNIGYTCYSEAGVEQAFGITRDKKQLRLAQEGENGKYSNVFTLKLDFNVLTSNDTFFKNLRDNDKVQYEGQAAPAAQRQFPAPAAHQTGQMTQPAAPVPATSSPDVIDRFQSLFGFGKSPS